MVVVRLLWLHARLAVLHELAYRVNLLVQALTSAIGLAGSLLFLAVLQDHTERLAGWGRAELLALWGVFYVLTGLLGVVVQPSLQRLIDDVRTGALDFVLTKPADAQALASIRQVEVWKGIDVAVGLGLLGVAVWELGGRVGPVQAAGFAVALGAGAAIAYGCCLMLATAAFWSGRVENVQVLFLSFWELGRWPVGVYPPALRGFATFVVPIALATTVPAEVLTARASSPALPAAVVVAAVLLVLSRWLWTRGVRRYAGASS